MSPDTTSTSMTALIAFLDQRLHLDHVFVAIAEGPGLPPDDPPRWDWFASTFGPDEDGVVIVDPARARTEVDAKRHILALHGAGAADVAPVHCPTCKVEAPCATVRHVASVYQADPEFQPGWAADPA